MSWEPVINDEINPGSQLLPGIRSVTRVKGRFIKRKVFERSQVPEHQRHTQIPGISYN